ncbi:MAG TPA: thioredoxin domain-containing protein [Actinocatenispora sp.]
MASKSKPKSSARPAGAGGKGPGNAGKRPNAGGGSAKQRAKAAKAVAAARADRARRNRVIITASVCAAVLIIVIGAVSWAVYETNKPKTIPTANVTANYPVTISGSTIVAGKDSAKTKIDIYEDFMCPYCGQLEQKNGAEMQKDLNNGSLQITYRIVDTLNQNSTPPGYSQRAANIAFGTVKDGKFAQFHWALFHNQPSEGGPGYSDDQMIDLAKRLGVNGDHITKVSKDGTYKKNADTQAKKLADDKTLHQADGSYGTPTVVHGGKLVDTNQSGWLAALVGSNG